MNSITRNTIFWAAFWILFAAAAIAAAVLIPRQIEKADEKVRQAQTERARIERELRELEQRRVQEEREATAPKTADRQRVLAIDALVAALEVYEETQGSYPVASGPEGGLVAITEGASPCSELLDADTLGACPKDPAWPERQYRYRSLRGFSYELTALLNGDDPELCTYVEGLCIYLKKGGLQDPADDDISAADRTRPIVGASLYDAISAAYTGY